jgi:tight adherence protein B
VVPSGAVEAIAMLAALGILFISLGAARVAARAERSARLHTFVRRNAVTAAPDATFVRPKADAQGPLVERLNHRLRQASLGRRVQAQLVRAGIDMPASRFLVFQGIATAAASLAVLVAAGRAELGEVERLGASAAAAFVGWLVPRYVLKFKEGQRLRQFERQLPPSVDAMAGALQAGSSLPQAMELIGREMPAPISEEFAIVVRELAVGVPITTSFGNMLERVRSTDLDMLLTAISIQHRVGGNLGQILRSIAHTVRERLRIRGEIAVLTAQQRISTYVVSGLPVIIIMAMFVIAPTYIIKLFQPGITRGLLVTAIVGMIAGYYVMRKIADIDV